MMMSEFVSKLLSISALSSVYVEGFDSTLNELKLSENYRDLTQIYEATNGLFAFESSLHVFPLVPVNGSGATLQSWNNGDWLMAYGIDAKSERVFAEDVIGNQFVRSKDGVYSLDTETGERTILGNSIEEWAKKVLEDFEFLTGYPLAHQWQRDNKPLENSCRLAPKVPFILGGEFNSQSLYEIDREKLADFRAHLFRQLENAEPGTKIEIKIVD